MVSEWIAAAVVDENGKPYLTKKQVSANFTQTLASAIFNAILGIEKAPVDDEGKSD